MGMQTSKKRTLRHIAEKTAPTMFGLSMAFLVCQAVYVVTWFDVPNFSENARLALRPDSPEAEAIRAAAIADTESGLWIQSFAFYLLFMIYVITITESAFHFVTRPWSAGYRKYHLFSVLFCIMPSLRMCARSPEMHDRLWLPKLGWRIPNKRLRRRLEKNFSMPMILIALLILPVFIVEFFLKTQVAQYVWLRMALHISTGVIWFAFAAEFILMVAVADKKIGYCKKHWVDLAIISLPLISFLRFLQVMRVQQIIKLGRVYRLRGTSVKALRALLLLDSVERLLTRNPERVIDRLQIKLDDVEAEAKELRRRITKLRRQLEEENAEDADKDCASESIQEKTSSPDSNESTDASPSDDSSHGNRPNQDPPTTILAPSASD
ncbi:MAG: potassium channel protein [Planctomycetota bacterium]